LVNKYQRIYNSLMAHAIFRGKIDGYKEVHHIKPKSMGGTNDPLNLVHLTAREHFIAHCILARIHGGTQWLPVLHFKGANKAYFNSRLYETARLKVSDMKKGCDPWNKGSAGGMWSEARKKAQKYVVHPGLSEETKAKHRKPKSLEHAENIRKAKLNQSEETRAKISAKHRGKKLSDETLEKIRIKKIGSTHSAETKQKMSLAHTGRKHSEESKQKMRFIKSCISLNKLINSIFTPLAA
jgi:hypothetical protein